MEYKFGLYKVNKSERREIFLKLLETTFTIFKNKSVFTVFEKTELVDLKWFQMDCYMYIYIYF